MPAESGRGLDATTGQLQQASGLCILLVDDDEADTFLINRALSAHPGVCKVVHARDGSEALAMVQHGGLQPDIAFIDLKMPRMDGLQLLVALGNGAADAFPMVVLTSSSAPNDAIRSRLRGAQRVVIKPENMLEMSAALGPSIDAILPRPSVRGFRSPHRQ